MDVREKSSKGKQLIDREALLSFEKMDAELCATCGEHHTAEDVIMMIKTAPTVDAVPVLRCRDCYHKTHDGSGRPYCLQLKMYLNKELDFFCKYGKRKEGAD